MLFTVIDTESTGLDPEMDKLVDIAAFDVQNGIVGDKPRMSLINPGRPIPPEASAIHHIVDEDVKDAPSAEDAVPRVLLPDQKAIYVAHNADHDSKFLKQYIPNACWICTYKAALRVFPDAPNHKNQTLRYWLDLKLDREIANQTHRAMPDAYVTAHLFRHLLGKASVQDMLAWALQPTLLPKCPIGDKWRGKSWTDVDKGFLEWMLRQDDMRPDYLWNARNELERRQEAERQANIDLAYERANERLAYKALAKQAIDMAQTVVDLTQWFRDEKSHRAKWGIVKGDPLYGQIVGWCAERRKALEQKEAA